MPTKLLISRQWTNCGELRKPIKIKRLTKLLIPETESIVFVRLHDFTFARTFIVNAAKMKNAVDNYAQKFVIVGRTDSDGIGSDSVERDEDIAAD